jgi:hypothetical protein
MQRTEPAQTGFVDPGLGEYFPQFQREKENMTDATTKKSKKPREKRHNLGKLIAAFQEAAAIAASADIQASESNVSRLDAAMAKAREDFAAAIGVPVSRMKVSVSVTGNTPAKRAA